MTTLAVEEWMSVSFFRDCYVCVTHLRPAMSHCFWNFFFAVFRKSNGPFFNVWYEAGSYQGRANLSIKEYSSAAAVSTASGAVCVHECNTCSAGAFLWCAKGRVHALLSLFGRHVYYLWQQAAESCLEVDKTQDTDSSSRSSSPVPGFSGTAGMETTRTPPSPLSDSSEDELDNGGYPPPDMESKLLKITLCVHASIYVLVKSSQSNYHLFMCRFSTF